MNNDKFILAAALFGSAVAILCRRNSMSLLAQTREKRLLILDEIGMDVLAVHNASDIINAQIERGEIADWDQLKQRVTDEVAFQKILLREDISE